MRATRCPRHLLALGETFADHGVHRGFRETRRNRLARTEAHGFFTSPGPEPVSSGSASMEPASDHRPCGDARFLRIPTRAGAGAAAALSSHEQNRIRLLRLVLGAYICAVRFHWWPTRRSLWARGHYRRVPRSSDGSGIREPIHCGNKVVHYSPHHHGNRRGPNGGCGSGTSARHVATPQPRTCIRDSHDRTRQIETIWPTSSRESHCRSITLGNRRCGSWDFSELRCTSRLSCF